MGSIDDETGQPSTRVLAYDVPSLVVDTHELSVSASGAIGFTLRAGKEYAGAPYVVLGTTGGTTPGVRLGGAHVPLNPSFYLSGSLMLDINPIQGGVGTLDPLGQAHASLPLIPGLLKDLVGTTMHHAYIVMLPDGAAPRVDFVSNAVALDVVP
jgi:hypothetical protein